MDLRIEGIAQDVIPKDEEIMDKIQKEVDKLRTGAIPNQSLRNWGRQEYPSCSAKSGVVQLMKWAILNCTSWDRYSEPSSASLA